MMSAHNRKVSSLILALGLCAVVGTCNAWVHAGGGGVYHGGAGGYHGGGYEYHGDGYHGYSGYYGVGGVSVGVGAPYGGYYGAAYPQCQNVESCNGDECWTEQVCN